MRLKSIKLSGFKSFANPTTFTFSKQITAIVGPNGCGKSNVIDAIRWALGESNARQLRSGAMSDVIFAGAEGKAGKSLASVELCFEHTQNEKNGLRHALNAYHELTLRRQITKDGKSDYFINGTKARRRDVVDVFLGTGLGARSYAVIEQGTIGRIVDADGYKLREFIEEAAGVSRYQVRRADTEKQLAKACDNLARLNDLQSELAKQRQSLQSQAQKAARWRELKSQLSALELQGLDRRLYDAHLEQRRAHSAQSDLQSALNRERAALQNAQQRVDAQSQTLALLAFQKDDLQKQLHSADLKSQAAEHAYAQAQSAQNALAQNLARLSDESADDKKDDDARQAKRRQHAQELAVVEPQRAQLEQACALLQEEAARQNAKKNAHQDALNALQNQLQIHKDRLNAARIGLEKTQEAQARLDNEARALAQEQNSNTAADCAKRLALLQQNLQSLDAKIDGLERERDELGAAKACADDALRALNERIYAQEKQHSRLASEYDTLRNIAHPAPQKTLSDSGFACAKRPAVQDALRLNAKGKTHAKALDGLLSLIKKDGFDPNPDYARLAQSGAQNGVWRCQSGAPALPDLPDLPKGLLRLSDLIDAPDLALWQSVCVLDGDCRLDWQNFDWQGLGVFCVLDKNGWLFFASGAVHSRQFGADDPDFVSARVRHLARLEAIDAALLDLENALQKNQSAKQAAARQSQELARQLDDVAADLAQTRRAYHDQKNQAAATAATQAAAQKDAERQKNAQSVLKKAQKDANAEAARHQEAIQHASAQIDALSQRLADERSRFEAANASAFDAKTQSENNQKRLHALQLQAQSHAQAIAHLDSAQNERQKKRAKDAQNLQKYTQELAQIQSALPDLLQKKEQSQTEKTRLEAQLAQNAQALHAAQTDQNALQKTASDAQARIEALTDDLAQSGAAVAVAVARLGDLADRLREKDAAFNLDARLHDFACGKTPDVCLDDLTNKQKTLNDALAKLGAVNLDAQSALEDVARRLDPMSHEIQDVQASVDGLKNAIQTINQKTKTLFLQTLDAINADLDALFCAVFGGGQASLRLGDDPALSKADKWRAPLELMAQPVGKKNSRLATLSGGEKTLTALSLVFAIFRQRPAPFCVLDEVDAPLDDANVARFGDLIRDIAKDVQFIFISHNKLAMQNAHELKGVTMQTAGVSSLVSVDLDEAMAMIDA